MKIREARQIFKSLSDDTRLRIVNLLSVKELSVSDLCRTIGREQSNVSKHLAKLRLTEVVGDERKGNKVYYFLSRTADKDQRDLVNVVVKSLSGVDIFKKDIKGLKKNVSL